MVTENAFADKTSEVWPDRLFYRLGFLNEEPTKTVCFGKPLYFAESGREISYRGMHKRTVKPVLG